LTRIKQKLAKILHFFGYNSFEGNETSFYEFNDYLTTHYSKYTNAYLKYNEQALNWVQTTTPEDLEKTCTPLLINDPSHPNP
jgi:hypothetical protein